MIQKVFIQKNSTKDHDISIKRIFLSIIIYRSDKLKVIVITCVTNEMFYQQC